MRPYLCLFLVVLALVLAACTLIEPLKASKTPTPTVDCTETWVCKCIAPINVEAWIDVNGNGERDPEDEPLKGVRFKLVWLESYGSPCLTPFKLSKYLTTDKTGHDYYELSGCGCGTETIEPETPEDYTLTTYEIGECRFEGSSASAMGWKRCQSYGFTPTIP